MPCFIMFHGHVHAAETAKSMNMIFQVTPIFGTITDAREMPLSGASIVKKETSDGATDDFDGNYYINICPVRMLCWCFYIVGFKVKEIEVNNQANTESLKFLIMVCRG